ncbi:unnamed protein product [Penicillium pancosmium]
MFALLTTLLALPMLGLICIPLLISAWITVIFALFTLFVRLIVVYTELVYDFIVNFFTLPAITSSLLTFAPSEPVTPAAGNSRRNSVYGLIQSRKSQDSLSSWSIIESQDDSSKRSKKFYARSMVEAHNLPTGFGLPVSGDERRDFEGVGGWRACSNRPKSKNGSRSVHEKPISSVSSSSAPSAAGEFKPDIMDDDDERAWLSLNERLELPSQVVTWGSSSNIASPTQAESFSPRGSISHGLTPAASPRFYRTQQPNGQRHHQRSHTTSSLTGSGRNAGSQISVALSNAGLARESNHAVSPSASRLAPFMTPQPYPTFRSSRTMPATSATNGISNSLDGGYFALQRPAYHYGPSLETRESPNWTTEADVALSDQRKASPKQYIWTPCKSGHGRGTDWLNRSDEPYELNESSALLF